MTNKEIIIGGVNVAKCNFLLERENKVLCESSHSTGFRIICECKNWTSCYFKQLAREKERTKELEYLVKNIKEQFGILLADKNFRDRDTDKLFSYEQALEFIKERISEQEKLGFDELIQLIENKVNEVLDVN